MSDAEMDRRLREAGGRLRATAPDAVAADTALDFLDDDRGRGPRRWWILPAVVATAAAATIIAVLVTRPDDTALDVVPATTPSPPATTAPPATTPATVSTVPPTTIPPTTVPTTTLPPARPSFPTEIPLDASAAIVGCPGTFGDLAAVVPRETGTIVGVACRGDLAVVATEAPATDGTSYELMWTGSSWTELGSGTSSPCPSTATPVCAAFGDPAELYSVSRPLPPARLVTDGQYLPAGDATDDLAELAVAVEGDAETFAGALAEALAAITPGDPIPRSEWEVVGTNTVVVTLRGIPDDASSRVTYVVRFVDTDGTLSPADGLRFARCDRGVTSDGLCL